MARTKGMLNLSGNLEVNAGAPLDARTVVPTAADLLVASNFQYKYVGMPVVVQATGDMYILTANDVTVAANWKQIGSGGGGSSYTAGEGIVIEDDEISTDNMPAADMSEIVTPLPSAMSRLPVLFDETGTEKQVGWYKNSAGLKKPLYEKDIIITNPAVNWTGISVTGSENWTKLHIVTAFFEATGYNGTLPWYVSSSNNGQILGFRGTNDATWFIYIAMQEATMGTVTNVTAIVRYTKSTDTFR